MTKVSMETKEQYKKRFWFMKNLAEKHGDNFMVCSEELAYAFVWELCERIQEELTNMNTIIKTDRCLQIYSFIERFPFSTDAEIIGRAQELYNMEYAGQVI